MSSAINTEALTKTYRAKKGKTVAALHPLTLEVKAGETFGFIGPNGAGKTTAIKILTGLLFPTSGKAFLFDKSVLLASARKTIGYLSEVAAYSPLFEALELLNAFGTIQGIPRNICAQKSEELLKLVGLFERRKSRLGEFSKGMLQRFGIAQALLHEPRLLILDEPTSGLDPIAQREVLNLLHDLKGHGITIFFSSHRLTEVEGLCDHVGIVNRGNIIFQGTLTQLEAQKSLVPFLVRFKPSEKPYSLSRALAEGLYETTVKRELLHQCLSDLIALGATVVSVSPQRSTLEEIFIHLITREQGGSTT